MLKSELYKELKAKYDLSKVDMFNSETDALDRVVAFVLNKKVLDIKLVRELDITFKDKLRIKSILNKLCNKHVPFQYITGEVYVYGIRLFVNQDVLIPRQDTECVIHEAISKINMNGYTSALDMCTGSGVIALAVANATSIQSIDMTDISKKAIKVATKNIELLGKHDKCKAFVSDIFQKIDLNKKYDIIVSNPPYVTEEEYACLSQYVKEEPYIALVAKDNGLYYYKKIAKEAKKHLRPGGALVFEIGASQGTAVSDILISEGYEDVTVKQDLNSNDRVVSCHFQKK